VQGASGPISLHGWLFEHLFAPWASPANASLAYAAAYLGLWLGVMWVLDRRHIRLTV
jgi:predicted acyltransferase